MNFGCIQKDTTGAGYAMKHMSKSAWDQVEAYAVLVKDKAGNVAVKHRHNEEDLRRWSACLVPARQH